MKRVIILLGSVLLSPVAESQTTPFAEPRSVQTPDWSLLSLANIMQLIQSRHIKLWYAGRAQDWDLINFESDHISDDLTSAAMLYKNIPLEFVSNANRALARLKKAAKERNIQGLQAAYADLTTSCNSCHAAGGVAFIRIQPPTHMPFTNQKF
ncbi:conserved hypothetical protein [Methylobacterium sp. 4-46]|uniref:cytochrome c n=1 Tax=unclassified Methylobacterium TaxID=2615210 RepID=UPI000152D28B|nr:MULTISPECIES: cytochrome c [Methylobacterium]ACA17304.1 conserved hypothetical protein [Methylobacterium sp. 4-46]WFT82990.1 cytochrome c [Methylobacterium nodulans]